MSATVISKSIIGNGNQATTNVTVSSGTSASSTISCLITDTVNGATYTATLPITWQPYYTPLSSTFTQVATPVIGPSQTATYLCVPSGGSGVFTYAWSFTPQPTPSSGSSVLSGLSLSSTTASQVTLSTTITTGSETVTTNLLCTITDSVSGATFHNSVTVSWIPPVPSTPTNVSIIVTTTTASVSFSLVTGATGYTFLTGNNVIFGTNSPLTLSGLTSGTQYTFNLVSNNASGNSIAFTQTLPTLPSPPSSFTATSTNSTTISVVFGLSTGATGYTATATQVITPATTPITVTSTTSPITINNLISGATYTVTLVAYNTSGFSSTLSSNVLMIPAAPLPSSIVTTIQSNYTSVSISFQLSNGATGYTVTSSPENIINTGTTSPILISGLTTNTTYTFAISANNASGTSTSSVSSSVFLPPIPTPTPTPVSLPMVSYLPTIPNGIILWLDASDPYGDKTTVANNTSVTTWVDKSGNNNNGTASSGVTYTTNGLNNRQAFSITNLFSVSNFFTGTVNNSNSTMTIFIVASMSSSSTGSGRFIGFSNGGSANDFNNPFYMGFLRQSTTVGPYRNGAYVSTNSGSYITSTPYLWECWYNGTNQFATMQVGNATTTQSIASAGNFAITYYTVGNNPVTNDINGPMTGFISEILVYNTSLSTTERQTVEGYLSWKWGLQANLPTSHPFYSSAPVGAVITRAWYGSTSTTGGVDVTSFVNTRYNTYLSNTAVSSTKSFVIHPSTFGVSDPSPGNVKYLWITYSIIGVSYGPTNMASDGQYFSFYFLTTPTTYLRIYSAWYGSGGTAAIGTTTTGADVSQYVIHAFTNNVSSFNILPNPLTNGTDPSPGQSKTLYLTYSISATPTGPVSFGTDGMTFYFNNIFPPTIISVAGGNGIINVSFTTSSYSYSYRVNVYVNNTFVTSTTTTTSPIAISGLTNGTTYNVSVSSVNAFGQIAMSEITSGTPAVVSTFTLTSPGFNSPTANFYYNSAGFNISVPASANGMFLTSLEFYGGGGNNGLNMSFSVPNASGGNWRFPAYGLNTLSTIGNCSDAAGSYPTTFSSLAAVRLATGDLVSIWISTLWVYNYMYLGTSGADVNFSGSNSIGVSFRATFSTYNA